ncbi:hypothetical protein FQN53_006623 [Emmonsiellopsis sp. PD_33]|nr:hypothetical protein FQN53_006623 [Emmonsiellopsis sp. PD_33]
MVLTTKPLILLAAASIAHANPLHHKRDIVSPLPQNANAAELKYQPWLDFDTDSCYNTAAVDAGGNMNPGLEKDSGSMTDYCRELDRLQNANVYSRQRCNNGICAIMYEYYFEKDFIRSKAAGHKHEWENVVVFYDGSGAVKKVAPSCHGNYNGASMDEFRLEDTHPKIIYHKDGASTHCFRLAREKDEEIENGTGNWVVNALVGWDGWPSTELRDALGKNWPGEIGPKWDEYYEEKDDPEKQDDFGNTLRKARGDDLDQFDPFLDG